MKYVFLACACLALSGCFTPLIGFFPSLTVTTGANVISHKITGKGVSDHALSSATGKDCHMLDAVTPLDVCKDKALPPMQTTWDIVQFQRYHELPETGELDEITMVYYNHMKDNKLYATVPPVVPRPDHRSQQLRKKWGWFQIHEEGIWYGRYVFLGTTHLRIYGSPRDVQNYK